MRDRDHDESMAEHYREFPGDAFALLNAVLEDGEPADLLIVLRQLAKAFGGVQAVAEKAELNPTQLYRTLSPEGNPSLSSLVAILKALNMQLVVKKRKASSTKSKPAPSQRTRRKPARADTASTAKVQAAR